MLPPPSGGLPPLRAVRLLDQRRERIRYLHYSRSTEDTTGLTNRECLDKVQTWHLFYALKGA